MQKPTLLLYWINPDNGAPSEIVTNTPSSSMIQINNAREIPDDVSGYRWFVAPNKYISEDDIPIIEDSIVNEVWNILVTNNMDKHDSMTNLVDKFLRIMRKNEQNAAIKTFNHRAGFTNCTDDDWKFGFCQNKCDRLFESSVEKQSADTSNNPHYKLVKDACTGENCISFAKIVKCINDTSPIEEYPNCNSILEPYAWTQFFDLVKKLDSSGVKLSNEITDFIKKITSYLNCEISHWK